MKYSHCRQGGGPQWRPHNADRQMGARSAPGPSGRAAPSRTAQLVCREAVAGRRCWTGLNQPNSPAPTPRAPRRCHSKPWCRAGPQLPPPLGRRSKLLRLLPSCEAGAPAVKLLGFGAITGAAGVQQQAWDFASLPAVGNAVAGLRRSKPGSCPPALRQLESDLGRERMPRSQTGQPQLQAGALICAVTT